MVWNCYITIFKWLYNLDQYTGYKINNCVLEKCNDLYTNLLYFSSLGLKLKIYNYYIHKYI